MLIHQPLGGAEGQAADIEITAREILRLRRNLYDILAKHTGQTPERIMQDSDRNYYLNHSRQSSMVSSMTSSRQVRMLFRASLYAFRGARNWVLAPLSLHQEEKICPKRAYNLLLEEPSVASCLISAKHFGRVQANYLACFGGGCEPTRSSNSP